MPVQQSVFSCHVPLIMCHVYYYYQSQYVSTAAWSHRVCYYKPWYVYFGAVSQTITKLLVPGVCTAALSRCVYYCESLNVFFSARMPGLAMCTVADLTTAP